MKILHLSQTTLSGSPYRLSTTLNKYSGHESRHIVWQGRIYNRDFKCDMIGSEMHRDELVKWLEWADVINFHNRWKRQDIFKYCDFELIRNKPSVIQMHSPREEEGHHEEVASGVPIAVIAQYHPRQWPEMRYLIPNVIDIHDKLHRPIIKEPQVLSTVSYAPMSPSGKGWNRKSYPVVSPILKRMFFNREIFYQRLVGVPHDECLALKQKADIGIDEISTGSYHMSSLEYLSMGCACFGHIDEQTEKCIKDVTGCDWLPWVECIEPQFKLKIREMVRTKSYIEIGKKSREWMEKYWNPEVLCNHFIKMYEDL